MRASLHYVYHPSNHEQTTTTTASPYENDKKQEINNYPNRGNTSFDNYPPIIPTPLSTPSISTPLSTPTNNTTNTVTQPSNNSNSNTNTNATVKIRLLQSHPVLSIIAIVEDVGNVILFDYGRNEVVHSLSHELLQQWILGSAGATNNNSKYIAKAKVGSIAEDSRMIDKSQPAKQSSGVIQQSIPDSNTMHTLSATNTKSKMGKPPRLSVSTSSEQQHQFYSSSPHTIPSLLPSSSSPAAFRSTTPTHTSNAVRKGTMNSSGGMNDLKAIRFFDHHTLFWESGNYRSATDHTNTNTVQQQQQSSMRYPTSKIILYYEYRNVIIDVSTYSTLVIPISEPTHIPTCIAYPLTADVVCIGCADGVLRLYDITKRDMLHDCVLPTVHKKGDFVVQILPACLLPYPTTTATSKQPQPQHNMNDSNNQQAVTTTSCRFVTLCSSGISYLWEFHISSHLNTNNTTQIDVSHPTARMDGFLPSTTTANTNPLQTTPMSSSPSSQDHINTNTNEKPILMYDPDRDILIGYLADKKNLGIWDLSTMKPNRSGVPSYSPFLKVKLPFGSSVEASSFIIIPGMHPNTSDMTLSLWTSTLTSSSKTTSATMGDNMGLFVTSLNSKELIVKPDCIWKENLGNWLLSLNLNKKQQVYYNNNIQYNTHTNKMMRVYCMTVLRCRMMSMVVYGTNYGVFFVSLEEDKELFPGARHVSLEEDTGSILLMEGSSLFHANIDSFLFTPNPVGLLTIKDPSLVYTSSSLQQQQQQQPSSSFDTLTTTTRFQPPRLLLSPSKTFLCIFWQSEYKYEIVRVDTLSSSNTTNSHTPTSSSMATNTNQSNNTNYAIDVGNNITSFAWIGTNDTYAILKVPHSNTINKELPHDDSNVSLLSSTFRRRRRLNIRKEIKSRIVNKLPTPTSSSHTTTNNLSDHTNNGSVDGSDSSSVVELKILLFPDYTNMNSHSNTTSDTNDPNNDSYLNVAGTTAAAVVGTSTSSGNISSVITVKSLGVVPVRGGIPIALFGGPVLCIASLNLGAATNSLPTADGMSYFYSVRASSSSSTSGSAIQASSYASIGPSLPYPDLVVWSDDGQYCCVTVGTRIAIYHSKPPSFALIGSTLLSSSSLSQSSDAIIESAKFLHGVLYCTSRTTVQCIFLGTSSDSFDTFVLASNDLPLMVPRMPASITTASSSSYYPTFIPTPLTLSLNCPNVLTYYHGSLLISTSTGIYAISLDHPLLRIGILSSSNQTTRASSWFQVIHPMYHEALANFLQRRGHPQLSLQLSNHLSLDYLLNLSLKYHFTDTLESLYEHYGFHTIRKCKLDHNVVYRSHHHRSVIECIAAYFLSQGNVELVRRIISECIMYDNSASSNNSTTDTINSRKEALFLSSLLYIVDETDGRRLMKRAVGSSTSNAASNIDDGNTFLQWHVGTFVKDNLS